MNAREDRPATAVLGRLRATPRRRAALGVLGVVLGLGLVGYHWSGFVLAGVAVGVAAGSLARAVALGAGLGIAAAVGFLGYAWVVDGLGAVTATGSIVVLALAIPPVLVTLGALVNGLLGRPGR